MGVPKFYRYISERYPCLSEVISDQEIPEFDNLYLDMNGVIHNCSHPNDDDVTFRITEEQIFQDIFTYIEKLYTMIQPQKVFMMAVDGVAPRAKMNQQRARRFMSVKTAELQLMEARAKGEKIPDEKRFDSNCITPGTYFMTTLHKRLADWVEMKTKTDVLWQGRRIYLSGHNCPGEGEHKIMDFIRAERASPSYDPNTRHCMYGLDADLIMLGIVTHEPHFSLLREEVKFTRPFKGGKKPTVAPKKVETKFHLLHLSLMREYLAWEFQGLKDKIPFEYDMERIADDWVLMGFLVGNDFLPHLPHIHIQNDALPLLYATYRRVLPTLNGYINEAGYLNLKRFETFLTELGKNDRNCFMNQMDDAAYLSSKQSYEPVDLDLEGYKTDPNDSSLDEGAVEPDLLPGLDSMDDEDDESLASAAFVSSDEEDANDEGKMYRAQKELLEAGVDFDEPYDEETALAEFMNTEDSEFENNVDNCWSKAVGNSFKRHKKDYYQEKLHLNNINKAQLKEQAQTYVRAIQWNLHYYYHGCVSWSWYYPFHYAPYISDIIDFADMRIEFELSKPFQPFEQLLGVLPAASSECLPQCLRTLMCDAHSPIGCFYPTEFATDLNGKKNDWEAVVLIPFIDEKRLLAAMAPIMHELNKEELARNQHGGHLLFEAKATEDGTVQATRTIIDMNEFRIDRSKVIWGLLPNVKMDIFFAGFPTMKHLPHRAYLKKAEIQVFNMPSRNESMMLRILNDVEEENDLLSLAARMLGEEVCVDWPILKLGRVVRIEGQGKIYERTENDEMLVLQMDEYTERQLPITLANTSDKLLKRYAIELDQKSSVLVYVARFRGMIYKIGPNEKGVPTFKCEKQFESAEVAAPFLLPLVVRNVILSGGKQMHDLPIQEAFPMKSIVWVTNPNSPVFGFPALVHGYSDLDKPTCKVQIFTILHLPLLDFLSEQKLIEAKSLRWSLSQLAARNAQVHVAIFNQITGHVFLSMEKSKNGEPSSGNKLNIGLALKYGRRELEMPDYTRRNSYTRTDGSSGKGWSYSDLTVKLVKQYKNEFPEVFSFLAQIGDKERDVDLLVEDLYPDPKFRTIRIARLKEFIEKLPYTEADAVPAGTIYADRQIIAMVEHTVDKTKQTVKHEKLLVDPMYLFRRELFERNTRASEKADFTLLDRVVCINKAIKNATVHGTVVGVLPGDRLEVIFDQEFPGGVKIRGSKKASGIILPASGVINLTFAISNKGLYPKLESSSTVVPGEKVYHKVTNWKDLKKSPRKEKPAPSGPSFPFKPKIATSESSVDDIEKRLKNICGITAKPEEATSSRVELSVKEEPPVAKKVNILELLANAQSKGKKKNQEEATNKDKQPEVKSVKEEQKTETTQEEMQSQQGQGGSHVPAFLDPSLQFVPQNVVYTLPTPPLGYHQMAMGLHRPMGQHLPPMGPPHVVMGQPHVTMGQPQLVMGHHEQQPMGQRQQQFQPYNNQMKPKEGTLTDFKPSTVHKASKKKGQKNLQTVVVAKKEQEPKPTTSSSTQPSESSSSSSHAKNRVQKKAKTSRLAASFSGKQEGNK